MERPQSAPEQLRALRHFEARVHIAKLATAMCAEFKPGHDVEQSADYKLLQRAYLLAQCQEAEIDKFEDVETITSLRG